MVYIIWIILGYIIGWIAPGIMRTNTDKSMLLYVILGIFGALSGGYLTNTLMFSDMSSINLFSIIIASIGSLIFMKFGKKIENA